MKELDEKIPCGLLEESWIVGAGKYGRKLGMDFLHPAYPMVTESYVQDAADHGLKVNTWTVNDWDRKGKVWKNRTLFFFCLYKRTETGIIIYKKKKNRRRHE